MAETVPPARAARGARLQTRRPHARLHTRLDRALLSAMGGTQFARQRHCGGALGWNAALRHGALIAVLSLSTAQPCFAQDAAPLPPAPEAAQSEPGLGERLDDPGAAPARPVGATPTRSVAPAPPSTAEPRVAPYLLPEEGSLAELSAAAERLRLAGRDDEALQRMSLQLLEPHPPASLEVSTQLIHTLRLLEPPPFDNAPIVLGAIFLAAGAAGTIGGGLAYAIDVAFSPYDEEPYILLFTLTSSSIVGGLLSLIFGLVERDTGAVGAYRSAAHQLHRVLRDDAHRARVASPDRRRR